MTRGDKGEDVMKEGRRGDCVERRHGRDGVIGVLSL